MDSITIAQLKEISLEDLNKYHDIMIHNLRVALKKARKEENRTDGDYSFTAQLLIETDVKPQLLDVLAMADCIIWKEKHNA